MASVNGYYTVAELEAYHKIDYGTSILAYTDAQVEATISICEGVVNAYMGTTYGSGTDTPETIKIVAMRIGKREMHNALLDMGVEDGNSVKYDPTFTKEDKELLDLYKNNSSVGQVDIIPLYRNQFVN